MISTTTYMMIMMMMESYLRHYQMLVPINWRELLSCQIGSFRPTESLAFDQFSSFNFDCDHHFVFDEEHDDDDHEDAEHNDPFLPS